MCIKYKLSSNERKTNEAYVTVEASLIIPLILAIIFALLYVSFMIHDMGWLKMEVDRRLEIECRNYANGDDSWNEEKIKKELVEHASKHMFLYKIYDVSFSNNCISAEICVYSSSHITNRLVNRLTKLSENYITKSSQVIPDYCSALRMTEVIRNDKSE